MVNPEGELQFKGFDRRFNSFSASAGLSYSFNDHLVGRFNLSKGFRAPNIAELSANGVHEGTYRYELGRNSLIPENSKQVDLGLSYYSMHIAFEADLFFNSIDHYIFLEKLSSINGGDSLANEEGYPVYQYLQGSAHLYGGELTLDVHPHPYDWIHFETTLGYTRGIQPDQPDSLSNLPLIPPMKVQSHIRIDVPEKIAVISGLYLKLGTLISFRQGKYYEAYGTETSTPAWWVLNATIGTDFCRKTGAKLMSVYLMGNNLLDATYQDHLSRLKYAPENPLTGKTGIFNMGRNITLKLIVPINSKFKS
jgi:iron complex outermembrane receptor protein